MHMQYSVIILALKEDELVGGKSVILSRIREAKENSGGTIVSLRLKEMTKKKKQPEKRVISCMIKNKQTNTLKTKNKNKNKNGGRFFINQDDEVNRKGLKIDNSEDTKNK